VSLSENAGVHRFPVKIADQGHHFEATVSVPGDDFKPEVHLAVKTSASHDFPNQKLSK
jgi:hypothetical protein